MNPPAPASASKNRQFGRWRRIVAIYGIPGTLLVTGIAKLAQAFDNVESILRSKVLTWLFVIVELFWKEALLLLLAAFLLPVMLWLARRGLMSAREFGMRVRENQQVSLAIAGVLLVLVPASLGFAGFQAYKYVEGKKTLAKEIGPLLAAAAWEALPTDEAAAMRIVSVCKSLHRGSQECREIDEYIVGRQKLLSNAIKLARDLPVSSTYRKCLLTRLIAYSEASKDGVFLWNQVEARYSAAVTALRVGVEEASQGRWTEADAQFVIAEKYSPSLGYVHEMRDEVRRARNEKNENPRTATPHLDYALSGNLDTLLQRDAIPDYRSLTTFADSQEFEDEIDRSCG